MENIIFFNLLFMVRLIIIIFLLFSCKLDNISKEVSKKANIQFTHLDSLLVDTPKILKGGTDYLMMSSSEHEIKYFGRKFAPYKLEMYDIAEIERMLDSLIKNEQQKDVFKAKSLVDFKYKFYSAITSNKNLETRILGFDKAKMKLSLLDYKTDACSFSIIYDLIKNKILVFQTIANNHHSVVSKYGKSFSANGAGIGLRRMVAASIK